MKRVLSLGAGVQSSTLLLMSCNGVLPKLDAAIFADTQFEPKAVYENLEFLVQEGKKAGIPVEIRTRSSIERDSLIARVRGHAVDGVRVASMPWFVDTGNPGGGRLRRQCTREYKLDVIERFIRREVLGLGKGQRAPREACIEQWMGISADEAHRAKASRLPFIVHQYPLLGWPVEMLPATMTRAHCLQWLGENYPGRYFPRSACIGCPFRSNSEWREMKKNGIDDWERAVDFDRQIRQAGGMRGATYTHRTLRPLDQAIGEDIPGLWGEECEGVCNV